MRRTRFTARLGLTAALVAAVVVPAASAGTTPWAGSTTAVATACDSQTLSTPFTAFNDQGSYVFAPNGGFEGGKTGWSLTGTASVVKGNETSFVHSAADTSALSLGAGAVAVSPAVCLGQIYPYSRLFTNGTSGGSLKAELLYVDSAGAPRTLLLGTFSGANAWKLSAKLVAPSNLIASSSSLVYTDSTGARYSAVAFRFTAVSGTWKLDDLYVDPYKYR